MGFLSKLPLFHILAIVFIWLCPPLMQQFPRAEHHAGEWDVNRVTTPLPGKNNSSIWIPYASIFDDSSSFPNWTWRWGV